MQKQKGISTLVGIIIIIAVAIIAFGGVFAYQYFAIKPQIDVQTQQPQAQIQDCTWPHYPNIQVVENTPDQTAGWKIYRNDRLGFSIKFPPKLIFDCDKTEVDLKIFDDDKSNVVYLAPAESRDDSSPEPFQLKPVTPNSFEILDKLGRSAFYKSAWQIVFGKVSNDPDLLKFFNTNFFGEQYASSTACVIVSKKESKQKGVFDVEITPANNSPEAGELGACFIGSGFVLKYYPEKQTAVFWDTGQSSYFNSVQNGIGKIFDEAIIDSFEFVK